MSKRSADEDGPKTIGDLMTGNHAGKKSKRAQYLDSGDFNTKAGDEWGKNRDKEDGGGGSEM